MRCQIVHDSWHARGFARSWLLRLDGDVVGYGSVGGAPGGASDTVKELFVRIEHRAEALPLFRALVAASGATRVEAQTNDPLLHLMLLDTCADLESHTVLFADALTTSRAVRDVIFRRLTSEERAAAFAHTSEPVGEWGLVRDGAVLATGGLLFHYNPPYGDIHMEVAPAHRGQGFGAYVVQELKRVAYAMGAVPAARCQARNVASRRALERAGMHACARIVRGRIVR
jgi:GNAT superfamily N-acetyltransferase